MANISLYERENETPGNQNPTSEVILNPEVEEPPSIIVPVALTVIGILTWEFLA